MQQLGQAEDGDGQRGVIAALNHNLAFEEDQAQDLGKKVTGFFVKFTHQKGQFGTSVGKKVRKRERKWQRPR